MKRLTLAIAALLATTAVTAQIYQWKDENGKTVISDKPPPAGARVSRKLEADAPASNATPQKTVADREMDFRKRQKESMEGAGKAQKEQEAAAEKKEYCEKSGRYLQTLESGERISLHDSQGERYYMEDSQRQQEIAKVKQSLQANCK